MIAIHQSGELLQITITGECTFDVVRELWLICKIQLHESKITRIEVLLKEVTSFNNSVIDAMLLISNWVYGNFHIYVNDCRLSSFIPSSL
ncbi:MAG: hypothetical protein ACXV8Q_12295, partial [Methylobacter sp.]